MPKLVPQLLVLSLLFLPFLLALVPVPQRLRQAQSSNLGVAYTLIPAIQLFIVLILWSDVQDGGSVRVSWAWLPALGVQLSFNLDGLSWLFTSLISGVGALVFIYAASYLHADPQLSRLYRFLLFFNGAMMGVVLADNLLVLMVFWELTSVSSFLLIGFRSDRPAAGEGATKAFGLTASGGLVMLFGIFLVLAEADSLELSQLLTNKTPLSSMIGMCFLIGAFTKSAQFPFHIWLPSAMEAPTPVSAYLHAATMVKAGLYLIARLTPLFAEDPNWTLTVTSVGMLTLVWGGIFACKQTDLKALLAYSTVSQLGLIVALLGVGSQLALLAAILHIVNHAAFKGALFLTAGAVEHEAGTRDIRQLGGMRGLMPIITGAASLATLSMAGLPPLGGFISKEIFYETMLEGGQLLTVLAVGASCFTFWYSAVFLYGTFFSAEPNRPHADHTAPDSHPADRQPDRRINHTPVGMALPIIVLSGAALLFGLLPGMVEQLITPALSIVSGHSPHAHLALWHGFTTPLMLSGMTVGIGLGLFLVGRAILPRLQKAQAPYSFNRLYTDSLTACSALFTWHRRLYMTGSMTDYVVYLLIALILGVSVPLWEFFHSAQLQPNVAPAESYEVGLAILTAVAGLACCVFRSRMAVILALGLVGSLVAMFFVLFSAPDLALTQIVVEAVGLVLFLLVLRFFSQFDAPAPSLARHSLHIGVSVGTGAIIVLVLLAGNIGQFHPSSVASYYLANSYALAGGQNVVNVILVDFRGFDTMGEITVFAVVAFGVFAMVQLGSRHPGRFSGRLRTSSRSPILQSFAQLTLHLMLLFSIYLLLRGHNAPGGGFIAGVLTAVAITFQMMSFDTYALRQETPWNPLRVVSLGLVLAALTGLGALVFAQPFLTSAFGHFAIPLVGEVELATAMVFDIGVYLVVVGTSIGVIQTIAEG